jgi:hypothetical protein
VTLFTHFSHDDEEVELEEMERVDRLCVEIPSSFSGVLELCLCRSERIAAQFRWRLAMSTVLSNRLDANPILRALLYEKAIRILAEHPGRYSDAVADIRKRVASL